MSISTLIVDDEPLARDGLRMLLAADADIGEIREAKNGRDAVTAIRKARPDLVFLDVQMPEMDGVAVVREVGPADMPPVVFVTAHDRYALQAFELCALDYLLKPVTRDRFAVALARAKERLRAAPAEELRSLVEQLAGKDKALRRVAVRSAGKTLFVDTPDIEWIAAAENYVQLHVGKATHLLLVTMNAIEKSLDPERFVRVHRSAIVQVDHIASLEATQHGEFIITLKCGQTLTSGRSYGDRLRALATNPF